MVCSALLLHRALYRVHCTDIMHSRKPSFVITTAILVNTVNRYLFNIRGNEIRHILLKQFHLNTLHTLGNRVMFKQRSADCKTISAPFMGAHSKLFCVAIVASWSWLSLWRHCWHKQRLGRVCYTDLEWCLCVGCPLRFTSSLIIFLNYIIFQV